MLKNNLRFILLTVSSLLLSCNNGSSQPTQSTYKNYNLPNKQYSINKMPSIFTLGGTYDSMSNHPTSNISCINVASDSSKMQIIEPQATLNFTTTASSSAVKNALGIEIAAQVGWGPFSAGTSYHYANTSQDDDYTLNLNYVYQYAGQYVFKDGDLMQGIDALTPEAKQLVENGQWVAFRQMCGDEFVDQMNAGASVLMKLSLSFNSHAEKNSFDNSMTQAIGLSDVISQIEHNASGINYHLQVSGIQVGGNPELLNQLFIKYHGKIGNDGYPVLDCGPSDNINSNCVGMINEVIGYASSVSNQLTDISSYYFYSPVAETWDKLAIFPGPANPDPAILQAMNDLSLQYVNDQANLIFLNHYYPILESANLLSADMKNSLSNLISNYTDVLSIYTDPQNQIMNCYSGYVSSQCSTIRDNIFSTRTNILSDPKLNQLLDYIKNNIYLASLWRFDSPQPSAKAICTLMPISDASTHLFLTDCDGQVSGTLDLNNGTSIIYDPLKDVLNVTNLSYSYYITPQEKLSFTYFTPQPLMVDFAMPNTWKGDAAVYLNNNFYDTNKLHLVKQY